jgi:hypothetical protein
MDNRAVDYLVKTAEDFYDINKDDISSFIDVNLDGFTFKPHITKKQNFFLSFIENTINKICEAEDDNMMTINPNDKIITIYPNSLKPKKIIQEIGENFTQIYQNMEIAYSVTHELCHMFAYTNNFIKPKNHEINSENFLEKMYLYKGITHALAIEFMKKYNKQDKFDKGKYNGAPNDYLKLIKQNIMQKEYAQDFKIAQNAYNDNGLHSLKLLLRDY